MKIVYMHHAQRDFSKGQNQENSITKFGVKEAENLGEMLKGTLAKVIYSGEYLRYTQTAELINKHIKAPIEVDKRLNEWNSKIETREEFNKRTAEFLTAVINNHNNDDIIFCITSGVNLQEFVMFFNKCEPIKGFEIMQAVGICPIIFHYNKEKLD